ncbi:MarR family winged helix-turn-helix transcriptional regulator [Citricoccus sp. GCM10030269]|uniref:MarR family winged helix-turn-helix transcriptional regulator n=1 Tax=Citricoccus sp. GCM10030269 TaxID=3273388 RepID=UPI003619E0E0
MSENGREEMGPDTWVGHLLRRGHQRHNLLWAESVGGILTSPQFSVLSTLAETSTDLDQHAVGLAAGLDRTTVAGVIRRLEDQGWLRRERTVRDARRRTICLSVPGRLAWDGLQPAVDTVQRRFLEPLDPAERDWFTDRLAELAELADPVELADPGGDRRPGHLIRLAQQRHTALWAEEVAVEMAGQSREGGKTVLTGPQFAVLHVLREQGALGQSSLADEAAVDRSSASDLLRRLEVRGWTVRRPSRDDRRTRVVELTDAGRAVVERARPAVVRVQERILEPVSAEDRSRLTEALAVVAGPPSAALARHCGGQ